MMVISDGAVVTLRVALASSGTLSVNVLDLPAPMPGLSSDSHSRQTGVFSVCPD